MLESLYVSEGGEPLQGYYSYLFTATKYVLVAVRYNWCAVRERELLEHHSIQLNDDTTEKETLSTLLLICTVDSNAGVRICKIQSAADSLCSMQFSSTHEIEARTRKYREPQTLIFVRSTKIRKIKIQEVILSDLAQQLKLQFLTSQMNV